MHEPIDGIFAPNLIQLMPPTFKPNIDPTKIRFEPQSVPKKVRP